jgi:hypothetical protein
MTLVLLQSAAGEREILHGPQTASPESTGFAGDVECAYSLLAAQNLDGRRVDMQGKRCQSASDVGVGLQESEEPPCRETRHELRMARMHDAPLQSGKKRCSYEERPRLVRIHGAVGSGVQASDARCPTLVLLPSESISEYGVRPPRGEPLRCTTSNRWWE